MATEEEIDRLWRDTGTDATTLPNPEADALFLEAAEVYSDVGTAAIYTRILVLRGFLASHAKMASYTQNEESENLSDVYRHLRDLLDYWQAKLDEALADAELPAGRRPAFFGLAKARRYGWR